MAMTSPYIGRFAPSPTGDLHFGSLVAALGSYLQARANRGQWLIRIENIDPPREVSGAAQRQLDTLTAHGLIPDRPVHWQFDSRPDHLKALDQLLDSGQAFHCACTRSDLTSDGIYPGTCRNGLPPGKRGRSIRLVTGTETISFDDRVQGRCQQTPARQSGDFVIRRADGLVAYQLAVVVDDVLAGVTEVVRGVDLMDSTGRQIMVYQALGLSVPDYFHLPLIVDSEGRKLSKSEGDDPIHQQPPIANLRQALAMLGHRPPDSHDTVNELLAWAIEHWNPASIPRGPIRLGHQDGVHPDQR